jgi:hypothetical protein
MTTKSLIVFMMLSALSCSVSFADGLSTSFADVTVSNVPVGKPWSIKEANRSGLLLQNLGKDPIHVHVKILAPSPAELKDHAKALPSVSWIIVKPNDFELAPNAQKECDVIIEIPHRWKYRHQYFQAMIFSRGAPLEKKSITLGTGLLSRLRFKTY